MSIDNNQEVINTVSIDDVNLDNLGQGYVDDDNNNKVEVKEEPKHFLQVLKEAINEQIKNIEEEKKEKASKTTNKQIHECGHSYVPRSNFSEPVNNSFSEQVNNNTSEKNISDGYEGFEIEGI